MSIQSVRQTLKDIQDQITKGVTLMMTPLGIPAFGKLETMQTIWLFQNYSERMT